MQRLADPLRPREAEVCTRRICSRDEVVVQEGDFGEEMFVRSLEEKSGLRGPLYACGQRPCGQRGAGAWQMQSSSKSGSQSQPSAQRRFAF